MVDRKKLLRKLGKQIIKLRKEKKLSQTELGYRCDLDRQAMNRIEAGRTNPTTVTLAKISSALSIPLKDLLDFE
jgi:transcriptional regulator with XRE-family HTH domain